MSRPLFLVPHERLISGGQVVLDGPEGHHAATVRRIGVAERVDLTDGAGLLAECVVAGAGRDRLVLEVLTRREEPAPVPRMVVVQALAKGERAELAVEAMTEVGADVIVPWSAARSVVRPRGDRTAKVLARWRSAAREAAKQSRRPWIPDVPEIHSTRQVADLLAAAALPVVLDGGAEVPLAQVTLPPTGEVVVAIGPEGGLTAEELATFVAAGATACRLGPTVLRTSTAGAAALAVLLSRTPRWS